MLVFAAHPFRTLSHQPDQPDVRTAMARRTILTEIPQGRSSLSTLTTKPLRFRSELKLLPVVSLLVVCSFRICLDASVDG